MAISRIGSATNNGTTITFGTHAKGDLLLFFASRFTSSVMPSLPAGVTELVNVTGPNRNLRCGYLHASSSSETIGTSGWTTSDNLTAVCYRSSSGTVFPTRISSISGAASTTVNFPVQTTGTFKTNASDLWLVGYHGNASANNSLTTLPPSGMSNIIGSTGTGFGVAIHDTNSTRTTSWPSTNVTVVNSVVYLTLIVELAEFDPQIAASGGGIFFRPGMSGGMSE